MCDYDREQELAHNLVTERKLELLLDEADEFDDIDGTADDPSRLNFSNGFAGVIVEKIDGYADVEKARARNNENVTFGINTKALLKQIKKLTSASELVKVANTHKLGLDLLTEICLRKHELEVANNEKLIERKEKRLETIKAYSNLINNKTNVKTWTVLDYKTAVKALKSDSDEAIPTKKQELVDMYEQIKYKANVTVNEMEQLDIELNRS